ncbi:MAG: hypothetical protein ABI579_04780 [Candidatus Sumerlaeota bacterium]
MRAISLFLAIFCMAVYTSGCAPAAKQKQSVTIAPTSTPAPVAPPVAKAAPTATSVKIAPTQELVPPVLVKKEAVKWPEPPAGEVVDLDMGTSTSFTLFIPKNFTFNNDGTTSLTVHFHGASWFVQQEHTRREATNPLLTCNAAEGDAVYETDVMKPGFFKHVLAKVDERISPIAKRPIKINEIELSSFSGGYSGARGLLRLPEIEPMISRLLLDDSLYIGDGPDSKPDDRKPKIEGLQPFIDYARKAQAGERMFVLEHSNTPSLKSVGPKDCGRAILAALGIEAHDVAPNSIPAARTNTDFALIRRADSGNAHDWTYLGENVAIHLSHMRNQADIWNAIEKKNSAQVVYPVMNKRTIKNFDKMVGDAVDMGSSFTLFLPPGYKVSKDGDVELTMHFHAASWFAYQEHLRRGMDGPLLAGYVGEGSAVYKRALQDPARFQQLIDMVTAKLKERGAPETTHVSSVSITSFSAGYGAVREILRNPANYAIIKRVILADSLYGDLDKDALAQGRREVLAEHVDVWIAFAQMAMRGEKTFIMTTSEIDTNTYAASYEVAHAIVKKLGLIEAPADPKSAAAKSKDYPLRTAADKGSFHAWFYKGKDPMVHMTLARRIAEVWQAADQNGDP